MNSILTEIQLASRASLKNDRKFVVCTDYAEDMSYGATIRRAQQKGFKKNVTPVLNKFYIYCDF